MKTRIIIRATKTPAGKNLSLDDIEDLNSVDRKADTMPYHYIINPGGYLLKGKKQQRACPVFIENCPNLFFILTIVERQQ